MRKRAKREVKTVGCRGRAQEKISSEEIEKDLADHIKKLAEQFHGQKKCFEKA